MSEQDAFAYAVRVAREEGIFVGPSSGAALAAVAKKLPEIADGSVVLTFSYDTGERYFSVEGLFDADGAEVRAAVQSRRGPVARWRRKGPSTGNPITSHMTHEKREVMATTTPQSHQALGDVAARQLANAQKTAPTMLSITPRWLVHLLPWVGVEAGIYRLNKVKDESRVLTACSQREDERELPETFVDYEEAPREFYLSSVTTVVDVHTRVSDLYSHPYDQIKEQLRLAIETIRERQEYELLHNRDYGILTNVAAGQKIKTLGGPPTPDDLDELITLVWKEPAFFLAHPKAIAAFGREATRRGVPPATVSLFGSPVITWRGIPLVPSSKLEVKGNKTQILLMRTGESRQGVVGLFQPSPSGEHGLGLSVKFMGISRKAIASYLISLYCSAAILTDDAVGVLEGVEVNKYHEYDYAYRQ